MEKLKDSGKKMVWLMGEDHIPCHSGTFLQIDSAQAVEKPPVGGGCSMDLSELAPNAQAY